MVIRISVLPSYDSAKIHWQQYMVLLILHAWGVPDSSPHCVGHVERASVDLFISGLSF